jgi:hypothetical protein
MQPPFFDRMTAELKNTVDINTNGVIHANRAAYYEQAGW